MQLRALTFLPPTRAPHANDGERFEARYTFEGEVELVERMGLLGLRLRPLPTKRPFVYAVGGPSPIDDFEHLAQPGHLSVGGVAVFVWVHAGFFDVTMTGEADPYRVDARDWERARVLDEFLATCGLEPYRIPVPRGDR